MELLTGYVVFHWIASWANPFCDVFFRIVTDLGDHTLYYLVVAPLFWVVDRRRAAILFLLLLASGYVNTFAKLWIHAPRPDPDLARVLDWRPYRSGSNAFPSGHAQGAVVFWGYLAWWIRQRWFTMVAAVMVLLICFSRLYLGVHFPVDILGGLGLGGALMLVLPVAIERWSRSHFDLNAPVAAGVVGASLAVTVASDDPTLAVISGSLLGFLAATMWLPQVQLVFANFRESSVGAIVGLLVVIALLPVLGVLPHTPLALYTQLAAFWIIALWVYPWVLYRAWLVRTAPLIGPDDSRR